jgi:hypothetical protein
MASRPTTLRNLAKLATTTLPKRHLHITGPATYPSTTMTETRTSSTSPPSSAPAASKRPGHAATAAAPEDPRARRSFNSSRTLKSVNDSSTIDFFFLPEISFDAAPEPPLRVPLLPWIGAGAPAPAPHRAVERDGESAGDEQTLGPLIQLVSGSHDHAPSPMSEGEDGVDVDFEGVGAAAAKTVAEGAEKGVGAVRQVWEGLLDDVLGPKKK